MKKLGVALVGCGRISDLHVLGYQDRPDASIVAVCDAKEARAKQKTREWGVSKVYKDYAELLRDPEIDLVELLVPHYLHCPMTVQAAQAGKHVSVQKPMCLSAAEADEMINAAEKAGVVLRVYENFVHYEPAVKAKELVDAGEIGKPVMLRMHINTGQSPRGWKIPLDAWVWRFNEKKSGGGELVFDHGYHLFSIAYRFMGQAERVSAWIGKTSVAPGVFVDAPATIMFQFKQKETYGVFDISHTPDIVMDSKYYSDDDRVEIIGEKGIVFINRYTTRTIDLPEVMLFKGGKTIPVPVKNVEWEDSFMAATRHLIDVLLHGGDPLLDGPAGKAVLQLTLAAQQSARVGHEVKPDEVQ
ncbi:MAG: Gfo/Idh/MocA family oxidoreductase [Chloroflexi bacterium]|nr:Gfo/Idh/MocA family oxidoreductase [Chloroflexota bacterium]